MPTPFLDFAAPQNSIIEFRLTGILHQQQVMMTFHYTNRDAPIDPLGEELQLYCAHFEATVWAVIRARISNEFTEAAITAQMIQNTRYRSVVHLPAVRIGTLSASALPSGVAVVNRRQGDVASRSTQGRIYVPGLIAADENDSQLSAAAFTLWSDNVAPVLSDFIQGAAMTPLTPVVYHPGNPALYTPVTKTVTDKILRYQRRREVGVGV